MESVGLVRFAAALFYSGIFWMTVLFLIETRALERRYSPERVGLALVVLIVSAYLMLGVIVHQQLFALPLLQASSGV